MKINKDFIKIICPKCGARYSTYIDNWLCIFCHKAVVIKPKETKRLDTKQIFDYIEKNKFKWTEVGKDIYKCVLSPFGFHAQLAQYYALEQASFYSLDVYKNIGLIMICTQPQELLKEKFNQITYTVQTKNYNYTTTALKELEEIING